MRRSNIGEGMVESDAGDPADGSASDSPGVPGREFYASPNGDRWRLLRDPADGRSLVRHTGNPASGGHVTDIALSAFLAADRGGPEHRALWDLIDILADGGGPTRPSVVT